MVESGRSGVVSAWGGWSRGVGGIVGAVRRSRELNGSVKEEQLGDEHADKAAEQRPGAEQRAEDFAEHRRRCRRRFRRRRKAACGEGDQHAAQGETGTTPAGISMDAQLRSARRGDGESCQGERGELRRALRPRVCAHKRGRLSGQRVQTNSPLATLQCETKRATAASGRAVERWLTLAFEAATAELAGTLKRSDGRRV